MMEFVMTQISGDPKFSPWPQVKGLILRGGFLLIHADSQLKCFEFYFIFYTYITLEFPPINNISITTQKQQDIIIIIIVQK